jgi:hypothetical protein
MERDNTMPLDTFEEAIAHAEGKNQDDTAFPRFYLRPVLDPRATEEQGGQEMYREVPFVEILIPGINLERPDTKVTMEHKLRWPTQWAAFEAKETIAQDGTPVEACAVIPVSWRPRLKGKNINTVEAFLSLPDTALAALGPDATALQANVIRWSNTSERAASFEAKSGDLEKEVAILKQDTESLTGERDRLKEQVIKLEEDEINSRGNGGGVDVTPLQSALADKGWPIGDLDAKQIVELSLRAIKKYTKKDKLTE